MSNRELSVARKRDIVARARSAARCPDLSEAWALMKPLKQEWADAGHAGEEEPLLKDGYLTAWTELKNRTDLERTKREAAEWANLNEKYWIIREIKSYIGHHDGSYAYTQVKELSARYWSIGRVPRDQIETLSSNYKSALEDFHAWRRREIAHGYWERIQKSRALQVKLTQDRDHAIRKLNEIHGWADPPPWDKNPKERIRRKQDAIASKERWIGQLEKRIKETSARISDLEGRRAKYL